MDETEHEVDLREYFRILRRRYLVAVLTLVVLVAAAVGFSLLQTKVYSATATVLVPQTTPLSQLNGQSANAQVDFQTAQRNMDNEVSFAKGDAVTSAAQRALGSPAKVSITSNSSADILQITAHNRNPTKAATAATAYANAYIAERRKSEVANYTALVNALRQSGQLLTADQQSLQAAALAAAQSGPTLINAAKVPNSPSSPNLARNVLLAAVIGLIFGVGLAFLVDRLDESIKSKRDLESASSGLPVLGLIAEVSDWRNEKKPYVVTLESPWSASSEHYRTLRTAVEFQGIDRPMRAIAITSPNGGEGKTVTVANLAVSNAKAGLRVVIVCCDLRKPRIHEFLGKSNEVGLTSVLLREVSLEDALQPIDGVPHLKLLASGPRPPNPAELLTLSGVESVFASLTRSADVVLVDAPPVLPVADALVISKLVDGVIVMSRARATGRRELHRALELLNQVDAPLIGTVLNSVPSKGGYDYGYGYGDYGYSYGFGVDGDLPVAEEVSGNGRQSRRAKREQFNQLVADTASESDHPER